MLLRSFKTGLLPLCVFITVRTCAAEVVASAESSGKDCKTDQSMAPQSAYDFTVKDIRGNDFDMGQLKGKVSLIVNVASQCVGDFIQNPCLGLVTTRSAASCTTQSHQL